MVCCLETVMPSLQRCILDYYELSNGGFYMAPCLDKKLTMFVEGNGYEGILSADAAGIVAS
jgi:hypothetical protein